MTPFYNDGATPAISYGYDRRGRQIAITNGTPYCLLSLNDAGEVLSEAYTGGALDQISITNGYDSLLRRTNVVTLSGGSVLTMVTNNFDAAGRLLSVSDRTNLATYSYLANSPLVSQITFQQSGARRMTTTKAYDNLNRVASISSSNAAPSLVDWHGYAYNPANQRTALTNTDSSFWSLAYDSLGQVISGKRSWSDGTPVAGQQFQYSFDDIGNRKSTWSGGDQWGANLRYATYAPNNLNQYTSRTVPGAVDVIGTATNSATVTVNNNPTYRKGSYYRTQLSLANGSAPVCQSVTNLAVLNNGTNSDIVTNINGTVYLPQTPENFTYDADGNLTQDGRWQYSWDGENRLVSMQAISAVPTAAKFKLDFLYDWQSRRIQKTVSTNNGSAYYPLSTNRFAYDGWNLMAILNPQSSIVQSFVWGLDLSGSLQGAGGVGGLVAVIDASNGSHFVAFDGNGNVSALTKATGGTLTAQYEYGPFGELIRATGPLAFATPFLFSTKSYDWETGLRYYGGRYYDPVHAVWLSRDPSGEDSSPNLYGFCANNAIDGIDADGLSIWRPWGPSQPNLWQFVWRGAPDWYTPGGQYGWGNPPPATPPPPPPQPTYGLLRDSWLQDTGVQDTLAFSRTIQTTLRAGVELMPQNGFSQVFLGETLGGEKVGVGTRLFVAGTSLTGFTVETVVGRKAIVCCGELKLVLYIQRHHLIPKAAFRNDRLIRKVAELYRC